MAARKVLGFVPGFVPGLLAALVAASCGYSPNPESGTLKCGTGMTCPEGYTCGLSNACWKNGLDPTELVGCWPFNTGSVEQVDCTDGDSQTTNLHDIADWIEITAGVASPLATHYYCPWELTMRGHATVIRPAQDCTNTDIATMTSYTYHGERFAFTSTDGTSATIDASLPYDVSTATDGPIGTCTLRITGTLTRGDAAFCVVPAAAAPTKN